MQICLGVFVSVLGLASAVLAEVTAERLLPGEVYLPGYKIQVEVKVTGEPGAVVVFETPPAGWEIGRVLLSGQTSNGIITWDYGSFTGSRSFKYWTTPPETATGDAVFSGRVGDLEISGTSRMFRWKTPANLHFPETTGPYEVGVVTRHLIDESRDETFTPDDPNDKRELMVDIWYPAEVPEGAEPGLYMPDADVFIPVAAPVWPAIPDAYWNCVALLVGNAIESAPLAGFFNRYPLVIYSHGHVGASRWGNPHLCEELASHGYIVVGINHTYNSAAVRFPDGRVALTKATGRSDWPSFISLHIEDVRFVLDELERINAEDTLDGKFTGRIDLSALG